MSAEHLGDHISITPVAEHEWKYGLSKLREYRTIGTQSFIFYDGGSLLIGALQDLRRRTTEWGILFGDSSPISYVEGTYVGASTLVYGRALNDIGPIADQSISLWIQHEAKDEHYPNNPLFRFLGKHALRNAPAGDFPARMLDLSRSLFPGITGKPSAREPYVTKQLGELNIYNHPTKNTLFGLGVLDVLDAYRFTAGH